MELGIQTLERKPAEIIGSIKKHEAQIAQTKHDLAHINATLKIIGEPQGLGDIVSQGFFVKGEIAETCERHLADGPLNKRELAERVRVEKGLDASDIPLRNSGVYKVSQRHSEHLPGGAHEIARRVQPACVIRGRKIQSQVGTLPLAQCRAAEPCRK